MFNLALTWWKQFIGSYGEILNQQEWMQIAIWHPPIYSSSSNVKINLCSALCFTIHRSNHYQARLHFAMKVPGAVVINFKYTEAMLQHFTLHNIVLVKILLTIFKNAFPRWKKFRIKIDFKKHLKWLFW